MSWQKTLADYPELMRQYWADGEPRENLDGIEISKTFDATKSATMVHAPCCGRRTAAFTVIDVRSIPGTIVRAGGWRHAQDHDWLCDGCRSRMIADKSNDWTLSKLLEEQGAPLVAVHETQAREQQRAQRKVDYAAGRFHQPGPARDAARERITQEHLDSLLASVTTLDELAP